jgi:hypothetical protein
LGLTEGIHWHINPDFQINYKSNPKRDEIYSVKIINLKFYIQHLRLQTKQFEQFRI